MIRETQVDGVQTLLAPMSGPLAAGLTFRVGRADETLATAGITHLLEHLALFRHGLSDYHYNGATGTVVTHFHMQGSEEDVIKYLLGVCDALNDLPLDRLEIEKGVLRTEAAGRKMGAADSLPLWRYGAQGYGLVSYEEMGLPKLTADDLSQWAATWFTRQNAVLWISSEQVPEGLRLRLPEGIRQPVPRATTALPQTPAYFTEKLNGVVYDAVVRRGRAASMFSSVLEREMFRNLRQEEGYSYVTSTDYEPRGDEYATVTALADALPDKQDAVLGGFIDVLAKLRVGRVEKSDLDGVRAKWEEALRHDDSDAARLPSAAVHALTGHPIPSSAELLAEIRQVTAEDVQAVAVEASATALLQVPEGLNAVWAGYTPAPTFSSDAVTGESYVSRENSQVTLVVGTDGVSVCNDHQSITVRYRECSIVVAWPDGGRKLIGHDGISLRIEPTLFQVPMGLIARIDASVPANRIVWMPARDPQTIPQPTPATAAPPAEVVPPPPLTRTRSVLRTTGFVVLIVLASIMGLLTMLCGLVSATADPQNDPNNAVLRTPLFYTMIACALLSTIGFIAGAVYVSRRRGPGRN